MGSPALVEWLRYYKDLGVDCLAVPNVDASTPKQVNLEDLHRQILKCKRCPLHRTRQNAVPGEGAKRPAILFIGEGPGEQEDRVGRPFVGKAGQLLDRMIERMGHSRESVFIGNIVKCRPPGNRDPNTEEVNACLPYLKTQIALLRPRLIVCLGKVAVNRLLDMDTPISRMRGRVFSFEGIPVIPTYHPSYILHQRGREAVSRAKWEVWADMQEVLKRIES